MAISAAAIARLHTIFAASAFLLALIIGSALHFHKIVKNDVAQYPDEWFPSVSATYVHLSSSRPSAPSHPCRIGDWYPERNIFQFFIALTAGTCLQRCLQHRSQLDLTRFHRPTFCHRVPPILPAPFHVLLASHRCLSVWNCTHSLLWRLGIYYL